MHSRAFLFALVTSFFWGLAPVFSKIGLVQADPTIALAWRSLVVSFFLLLWAVVTGNLGGIHALMLSKAGVFIAAEGICASLLGHLAYYYALKYGDVSRLVPVAASFPLIAMVLAMFFLSEQLTPSKAMGGVLIVVGVVLIKR